MIRKLRIKFVTAAMISVFGVLMIILGTINVLNYKKVIADADEVLLILAENQGAFPEEKGEPKPMERMNPSMSPELPFETRYFSVVMDKKGNVIFTDTGKIAAVDSKTAREYAQNVMARSNEQGFIADYRYSKQTQTDEIRIIFLDCTRSLSTFRSFFITSALVSCIGLLAVFVSVIFFSERIVRPFSESYEKQKRFITDAGHEIKTPLTIIDADAAVLEMECGENEWIQDIQKQTLRLKELTNDLIYLSRMEENKGTLPMIDFPISDIVAEMAQSFQSLAVIQDKRFECRIEPMLTYRGNEKDIRKLLSILLDNALKYSEAGGYISLSLAQNGKNLCLSVFNTTRYIPREALSHMFDRFYRIDKSRNSKTGGYGIGLSIAQAITAAHRGKISASSSDGKSLLITVMFN